MNVRKFTANSSRGAWHLVREALGSDAVILSNRKVENGIEILALAGEDMAALAEPMVEKAISEQTLASFASAPKLNVEQLQAPLAKQSAVPPSKAMSANLDESAMLTMPQPNAAMASKQDRKSTRLNSSH